MFSQGTIPRFRYYFSATTNWRAMAAIVYTDSGGVQSPPADTKTWVKEVGHEEVQVFDQPVSQGQTSGITFDSVSHEWKKPA